MKNCPHCNAQLDDNAAFCTSCGTQLSGGTQPNFNNQAQTMYQQPVFDPYDHTSEFTQKDISDNKVIAMLVYLAGFIGIIIALIASGQSPYVAFHVRQALKFMVVELLLVIVGAILAFTIIVPIAAIVCFGIIAVLEIICFFQVCGGKAKEPAIIRSLGFLK